MEWSQMGHDSRASGEETQTQVKSGTQSHVLILLSPLLALTDGTIPGGGGRRPHDPAAPHGGVQPVSRAGATHTPPEYTLRRGGSDAKWTRQTSEPDLRTHSEPHRAPEAAFLKPGA